MERYKSDFEYFWSMIENGENFTFARYADGEVMLMNGEAVGDGTQAYTVDKWKAPNSITKVGKELLLSLNHTENNYYYAISAKNDRLSDYLFLKGNILQPNDKITFVNLWINANYTSMVKKLNAIKRDVIMICNEKAKKENFPFNVIDITPFPNDCINFWENNGNEYMDNLIKKYSYVNDKLFLISCGPVSEIIIDKLYTNNPNNSYIDVGSSIDEFVHGRITRPYMNPHSTYANTISSFE